VAQKKDNMNFRKIFTITLALCITLTGCAKLPERTIQEAPKEVASYSAEQMYVVLASRKGEVRDVYTNQIFDVPVGDGGVTYTQSFNDMVKDYLEKVHVMTQMADEREISLTADETKRVEDQAAAYMKEFENSGNTYEITAEDIEKIKGDLIIIDKLREKLIEQSDIEVSESDARVMDLWRIECDDSEAAYATLEAISADPEIDFQTLARRNSVNSEIQIQVPRGELGDTIDEIIFALEDGEVSPVIPVDGKYYIFKCITGYDEEATAAHKSEMAKEREARAVGIKYEEYVAEHPFSLDEETWGEALKMCSDNPSLPDVYKTY